MEVKEEEDSFSFADQGESHPMDCNLTVTDVRLSDVDFSVSSDDSGSCRRGGSKGCSKSSHNTFLKMTMDSSILQPKSAVAFTPTPSSAVDKSYVCQLCSGTFEWFESLQVHAAHIHGVNMQTSTSGSLGTDPGHSDIKQEKMVDVKSEDTQGSDPGHCDIQQENMVVVKSEDTQSVQSVEVETGKEMDSNCFPCNICGESFGKRDLLQIHSRVHFQGNLKSCYTILSKNSRTLTGDNPYTCKVCGKAFNRSGDLRRHERTHPGDKPYICKVCGKAFCLSACLMRHEMTHTGDKPYDCNVCGKSFSVSCTLKRHERIHTGDKPYVCKICGKSFSVFCNLTTHNRIHTGDKPYV